MAQPQGPLEVSPLCPLSVPKPGCSNVLCFSRTDSMELLCTWWISCQSKRKCFKQFLPNKLGLSPFTTTPGVTLGSLALVFQLRTSMLPMAGIASSEYAHKCTFEGDGCFSGQNSWKVINSDNEHSHSKRCNNCSGTTFRPKPDEDLRGRNVVPLQLLHLCYVNAHYHC